MDTTPWNDELSKIIPTFSTNKDYESYDLIDELERRSLFSVVGRKRTAPQEYRMSVDRYVEMFHARNGFSRQRMDAQSAAEFDTAVREIVSPFATNHVLNINVTTGITWGHPSPKVT